MFWVLCAEDVHTVINETLFVVYASRRALARRQMPSSVGSPLDDCFGPLVSDGFA